MNVVDIEESVETGNIGIESTVSNAGENGGEKQEEVVNEAIEVEVMDLNDENGIEGSTDVGKEDNCRDYEHLLEDEDVTMVEGNEKDYKRRRLVTQPIEQGVAQSLPKRTRSKTAKAAPYENYAELHAGRKKSLRSGDRVQGTYGRPGSGRPI